MTTIHIKWNVILHEKTVHDEWAIHKGKNLFDAMNHHIPKDFTYSDSQWGPFIETLYGEAPSKD